MAATRRIPPGLIQNAVKVTTPDPGSDPGHFGIPDKVKQHTKDSLVCAQMGRRPPGYSVTQWALHLFDFSSEKLQARLVDQAGWRAHGDNAIASLFDESRMPAPPEDVPAELIPKMRQMHRTLVGEAVKVTVEDVLLAFTFSERSPQGLHRAQMRVQIVLEQLSNQVAGGIPLKVRIKMKKDGKFVASYEEIA